MVKVVSGMMAFKADKNKSLSLTAEHRVSCLPQVFATKASPDSLKLTTIVPTVADDLVRN